MHTTLQRIIDFHNHIFPENIVEKATGFLGDYYRVPIEKSGLLEDLFISADEVNIETLVVHATATKASQVQSINNYIAETAKSRPRLVGFGSMHPDMEDPKSEFARMKALGLRGIKLHPDFQGFKFDCDRALKMLDVNDGSLPVLVHAGDETSDNSSPKRISNAMKRFPHITFIAAHLGGYRAWDEAGEHLSGQNIYYDSSSSLWVLSPEEAVKIIRAHGVEKVLYGTDYPMSGHASEMARFLKLSLTKEEQEKILFHNADKLLQHFKLKG